MTDKPPCPWCTYVIGRPIEHITAAVAALIWSRDTCKRCGRVGVSFVDPAGRPTQALFGTGPG
jgi:hypothetical protein